MKTLIVTIALVLGSLHLDAQNNNQVIVGFTPCVMCNGQGGTFIPYYGPIQCNYCKGQGFFPITRPISDVSGGPAFYGKHYTETSKYVFVTCETGVKKGYFRVFLSDGKKYIKFPKGTLNYVRLGNGDFLYGANRYFFK